MEYRDRFECNPHSAYLRSQTPARNWTPASTDSLPPTPRLCWLHICRCNDSNRHHGNHRSRCGGDGVGTMDHHDPLWGILCTPPLSIRTQKRMRAVAPIDTPQAPRTGKTVCNQHASKGPYLPHNVWPHWHSLGGSGPHSARSTRESPKDSVFLLARVRSAVG